MYEAFALYWERTVNARESFRVTGGKYRLGLSREK